MASHLSYQEVDGCARTSPPLHTLGDLSHAGRLTDGGRRPRMQVLVSFIALSDSF
jgi:hypothetical protein